MEDQNNQAETLSEIANYPSDVYNLKKHTGETFIPKFISRYEDGELIRLRDKIQAVVTKSHEERKRSVVISVCSEKGGVGKSTMAVCIGQLIANLGFSVLLVDVDANRSASDIVKARIKELNFGISYGAEHNTPVGSLIDYKKTIEPIMDYLVEDKELFNANTVLNLANRNDYDVIIFDTPGIKLAEAGNFDIRLLSASGKTHITAAYTSDFILIPTGASNMDLASLATYVHPLIVFIETLKALKKNIINTQYRILACCVEGSGSGLKELQKAESQLGANWFKTRIRRSEVVAANTSRDHGDTIYTKKTSSKVIDSFIDVVDEMFDDISQSLDA